MPVKQGKYTLSLPSVPSVAGYAAVVGKKEGEGPLGAGFDYVYDDAAAGQKSWEKAESTMHGDAVNRALTKAGVTADEVDVAFAGDLLDQCIGSSFALRDSGMPFVGLYGACSTMALSLAAAAVCVDARIADIAVASTSSHFCSAEKQFRMPLEYGGQRTPTAQWTATAAGAAVISRADSKAKIDKVIIGRICDYGVKDANNMGAAMATAAVDTILRYFDESGRDAEDFDCIVTGDLGAEGKEIAEVLLKKCGFDPKGRLTDCGMLIFDREKQDVNAGGSGCGCSATVTASHFYPRLRSGELHDMLLIGTGALLSPKTVLQKESIPSVAHLVHLRRTQK